MFPVDCVAGNKSSGCRQQNDPVFPWFSYHINGSMSPILCSNFVLYCYDMQYEVQIINGIEKGSTF